MPALLPLIRKAASLQQPRRGQHGVLSASLEEEARGRGKPEFRGVLPAIDVSTSPWPSDGHSPLSKGGLDEIRILPPTPTVDDGLPKPWTPASQALKPHTPLVRKTKPKTPRTVARQDRRRKENREVSEARRELRGVEPGDWDCAKFLQLRCRCVEEGKSVAPLLQAAAEATETALHEGSYKLPTPAGFGQQVVGIPLRQHVQWFGSQNVAKLVMGPNPMSPPLICTALNPLEAAEQLGKLYSDRPIILNVTLTEFSPDGMELLKADRATRTMQQELFIRTSFEYFHNEAARQIGRDNTIQEHLAAENDPYLFAAHDVVLFRGSAEDGYPFLENLSAFHLLVSGRANNRPEMSHKGEYFSLRQDMIAFVERLNLLAGAGITMAQYYDDLESQGQISDTIGNSAPSLHSTAASSALQMIGSERKPVLVIGMHDLTERGHQQPRLSMAAALKTWRQTYSEFFEAVVVACGEEETANIFDKQVNASIYANAAAGKNVVADDWCLDLRVMAMSVNSALGKFASQYLRAFDKGTTSSRSSVVPPCRRRSSQGAMAQRAVLENEQAYEQHASANQSRRGSAGSRQSSRAAPPQMPRVAPPPQPPEDSSGGSRALFERSVANRLEMARVAKAGRLSLIIDDAKKKEFYQNVTSESKAMAGAARAVAVGLFAKGRRSPRTVAKALDADEKDDGQAEDTISKQVYAMNEAEDLFDQVQTYAENLGLKLEVARSKHEQPKAIAAVDAGIPMTELHAVVGVGKEVT